MEIWNLLGKRVSLDYLLSDGRIFKYAGIVQTESPAQFSIIDDKTGRLVVFAKDRIARLEVSA